MRALQAGPGQVPAGRVFGGRHQPRRQEGPGAPPQAWLAEDEEKRIRKAFRNPDEKPKILIVTEKLLTGFDAPILYCMYLDKPMRDHVLLQAIARVNRPYEDNEGRRKPSGFVLDFVGIFEKLEKALAFDSQDVEGVVEGLDVLKERFEELMAEGRTKYLPIPRGRAATRRSRRSWSTSATRRPARSSTPTSTSWRSFTRSSPPTPSSAPSSTITAN